MSKVYEIEGAEIKVVSGEFTENKTTTTKLPPIFSVT